jgi:hypothetical protein
LEVKSTTKGFLPPRMTNAERNSIATPATGLLIYQTDAVANNPAGLYFYDGTAWKNGLGVVGATGATGPVGPAGANGAKGDKGETGMQGEIGLKGDTGAQGETGAVGQNGDKGDKGDQGIQGAVGAQGIQGVQGVPGAKGETGATGPAGLTGPAGAQGAVGPQGTPGSKGETGATGATGPKGETGATGPAGPAGAQGAVGPQGPAGSGSSHYIGESYGGGIVYYVYDNGQHGLIVSTTDLHTGISSNNPGFFRYTGSTGDGVGAGEMNTAMIVAAQLQDNPYASFAAKVCADYSNNVDGVVYGDWYLPSITELSLLFAQKVKVPNLGNNIYWSSTEDNDAAAWLVSMSNGNPNMIWKGITHAYVRAIRSF